MRHWDTLVAGFLGVCAFILYWRTMAPTVLDGDNGEFQFMAYILGVPHSTGYPLFMLLLRLFLFLPIGDVAYRVNLFSVLLTAIAVPFVYLIGLRLLRSRVPALLATLALALTLSIWGGALDTKPYAFHFLLGVLALFFALRWHQDGHARDFYALALTYGCGLVNHHVLAFTAPAFALTVWLNRARVNRKMIAGGIALVLLPLLLNLYIPIRANYFIAQQSPQNWQLYQREDAILKGTVTEYYINTPQGFFNLITGLDNIFKLGFKSGAEQSDRSVNAFALLVQQFTVVGLAMGALGAVVAWRRDRELAWILFLYGGGIALIAYILRGISTVYYFSLAYLILALLIGYCLDALMHWTKRVAFVVAILFLALPIYLFVTNYAPLDQSNNYTPRDYAQSVLNDNLAPNAVVIAPWEVSEPIHYFQFVDQQRADALVFNVSPSSRQFETVLQNAHKLNRPFYLAQFNPEVVTPGLARSIQAIPLPLMQPPQPQVRLTNAKVVPQVQVLGYDLASSDQTTRLLVYYRATERMYPMYSATLTLTDLTGKLWKEIAGFPGSFYFPTYRWYELGEYYRDTWFINLPPDAPSGLYHAALSWFVYNRDTDQSQDNPESVVDLGLIRLGDLSATNIAHPSNAKFGDAISFLGWSGDQTVARGQSLPIDLFWRADKTIPDSYTVFVHLVDANGQVITDADSPPSSGIYPTDRWRSGESMRDRHILKIPNDLAPGDYSIEIGMYLPATGARLPIEAGADHIRLMTVSVH